MKTLFQIWCESNDKQPLPQQYQQQENPYLQTLKLAEVRTSTFEQRQARRVRTWYENHPECKHELLPLDWRDQQLRGENTIGIESRAGRGWFDKATGVRVVVDSQTLEIYEEDRPAHRLSEVESLDRPLAIASIMSSANYQREILEEYPISTVKGIRVNKGKGRKKADKSQAHKQDKQQQLELDLRI